MNNWDNVRNARAGAGVRRPHLTFDIASTSVQINHCFKFLYETLPGSQPCK